MLAAEADCTPGGLAGRRLNADWYDTVCDLAGVAQSSITGRLHRGVHLSRPPAVSYTAGWVAAHRRAAAAGARDVAAAAAAAAADAAGRITRPRRRGVVFC